MFVWDGQGACLIVVQALRCRDYDTLRLFPVQSRMIDHVFLEHIIISERLIALLKDMNASQAHHVQQPNSESAEIRPIIETPGCNCYQLASGLQPSRCEPQKRGI